MPRQMSQVPHFAVMTHVAHPAQRENHSRYQNLSMARWLAGRRRQTRAARLTEQFRKKTFDFVRRKRLELPASFRKTFYALHPHFPVLREPRRVFLHPKPLVRVRYEHVKKIEIDVK